MGIFDYLDKPKETPRPSGGVFDYLDEEPAGGVFAHLDKKPAGGVFAHLDAKPRFKSGGILANFGEDISNVASGFAQLPAVAVHAAMNPEDIPRMAGAAWTGLKEEFGEWRDPLARIYNKPFSSFLDVITVLDLPALAAKGGAAVAGKLGAKGAQAGLTKLGQAAEKITLPGMVKAARTGVPGFLENLPTSKYTGVEQIYADLRKRPSEKHLRSGTQRIVSRGTAEHMFELRDPQRAAIAPIYKDMNPREKHAAVFPVNYGYTVDEAMAKFGIPATRRGRFEKAVADTKLYSNDYGDKLIAMNMLSPEVAEKSRWMGVATREAMGDSFLVQRFEEPGKTRAMMGKPQGIYTTPGDVISPHSNLGGDQFFWRRNPSANVLNVDASSKIRTNRGHVSQPGGIAALRSIAGDTEFEKLAKMPKIELLALAKKEYPSIQWERYYDAHDILDALGGVKAKEAGYDAIFSIDKAGPQWNEYIMLSKNAGYPIEKTAMSAEEISKTAMQILDNPAEFTALQAKYAGNEPAYVTHHLEYLTKMKPGQVASFFAEAQKASQTLPGLQSKYKAPVFKKSKGFVAQEVLSGRYMLDTEKALISHADMVAKQMSTENMFGKILAMKNRDGSAAHPYIGTPDEFYKKVKAARKAGTQLPQENFNMFLEEKFAEIEAATGIKHVPFAPEGFLKFGRATVDSVGDVLKFYEKGVTLGELENIIHTNLGKSFNVTETLKAFEAVAEGLGAKMPEKMGMFVKRMPIYAMPVPVANFLKAYMQPQNAFAKLFISNLLQYWKMNVLGLSARWVVNNVLGNVIFNTLDGVGPKAYGMALKKGLQKYLPPEVSRTTMTKVESQIPNLGDMSGVPFGDTLKRAHEAFWGKSYAAGELPEGARQIANIIPAVNRTLQKGAGYVYAANEAVESFARNANYFQKALDEAGRTGKAAEDVLKSWGKGSAGRETAIKAVNEALYDYMSMAPWEKQFMKPYVPFYGFWKHASLFFLNLPFKHPMRAQALKMLSVMGNEVKEDRWEQETGGPAPQGQRYSTPIGQDAKKIHVARTTGWNPFSMVQTPNLGMVNPFVKVAGEQLTGVDAFTLRPFESNEWKLNRGGQMQNARTGELYEGPFGGGWPRSPAGPDILSHVARQFPIYQSIVEPAGQAASTMIHNVLKGEQIFDKTMVKQYPASNIFSPMPKAPYGQTQSIDILQNVLNLLGVPIGSIEAERIYRARAAGQKGLKSVMRKAAGEQY